MNAGTLTNAEGLHDFDVTWGWATEPIRPGLTAVLRVKDEARSLPWVLPPLLAAVDRVVLVDNGSTDGTAEVARKVAAEEGVEQHLRVHTYPFRVARCGREHLATPATSVHSLVYFYNWSFAHVRTSYALKWDGDMMLTEDGAAVLRDLAWQLEAVEAVVLIPRYPLYLGRSDDVAFLDVARGPVEPWAWPNNPDYHFVKAFEWELPLRTETARMVRLPEWMSLELKHLDADEFSHWSHTDFEASTRTTRKSREWEVFHALADGGGPPEGVITIEAPAGTHVLEYARRSGTLAAILEGASVARGSQRST